MNIHLVKRSDGSYLVVNKDIIVNYEPMPVGHITFTKKPDVSDVTDEYKQGYKDIEKSINYDEYVYTSFRPLTEASSRIVGKILKNLNYIKRINLTEINNMIINDSDINVILKEVEKINI